MSTETITLALTKLAWRDMQMDAIHDQLELAFPELLENLLREIDDTSTVALVWRGISPNEKVRPILQEWSASQAKIAASRAEADLAEMINDLPQDIKLAASQTGDMLTWLPAATGVGLLAASIAAIPTVASFATVSTSIFAVFATATISWPLVAVGALGIGLSVLAGSTALSVAASNFRQSYREQLTNTAYREVFGFGAKYGARCIVSDIQASVLLAGDSKLKEST